MLITGPSGLSFHARKWKIGDRRNLRDRNITKQGLLLKKMLEVVDEGIEDPGPYTFLEQGKPGVWNKISIPDILDSLIDIRISTKPILDYNESCAQCGAKIPLSIDLRDLIRAPMSDIGKGHLSSGIPIETILPCEDKNGDEAEAKVKVRFLLGEDMPKLTKYYQKDPALMEEAQQVLHMAEISVPWIPEPLKSVNAIWDFYKDQPWEFQSGLEDFVAKISGGVDTKVETDCPRCHMEQTSVIPFGVEFFYPQKSSSISSMGML